MRRLVKDRRGVAVIEFAMVSPLLFLLVVGFLDAVYLGRGHMRVQNTAAQIGQIISQCTSVARSDEAAISRFAALALKPYSDKGLAWEVIVTAIQVNAANTPSSRWTMKGPRLANGTLVTDLPSAGVALPANFRPSTETMIFRVEVFATIETTLLSAANSLIVQHTATPRTPLETASTDLLFVSRAAKADKLQSLNQTPQEPCL